MKRDANPRFNNVLLAGTGGIATTPVAELAPLPFAMARDEKGAKRVDEKGGTTKGLFRRNDFQALSYGVLFALFDF